MNPPIFSSRSPIFHMLFIVGIGCSLVPATAQSNRRSRGPEPPPIGSHATNFLLRDVDGDRVELEKLTHYGPVALIFLRGYPETQSALCRRQFREFLQQAGQFGKKQASVVFVYPGDRHDLEKHATDFVGRYQIPRDFYLVLDSDFRLSNAYGLKWNAIRETTYPCTLIIDRKGIVRHVAASNHHGGRTKPAEVLAQIEDAQTAFRETTTIRRR